MARLLNIVTVCLYFCPNLFDKHRAHFPRSIIMSCEKRKCLDAELRHGAVRLCWTLSGVWGLTFRQFILLSASDDMLLLRTYRPDEFLLCQCSCQCSCHRSNCNVECLNWLILQSKLSATGMVPVSGVHLEVHYYYLNCRSYYFLRWWQDRRSAYSGTLRCVCVTIIGVNKQ